MLISYVDESGTCETFKPEVLDSTPVFVVVGVHVPESRQKTLTMDFLKLKEEFVPQLAGGKLTDLITAEMKGDSLRRDLRRERATRNTKRRALSILSRTLGLLEEHNCLLSGRVVNKPAERVLDDRKEYGRALQHLASALNSQCAASRVSGLLLLDSRTKVKNEGNVHTITTGRFRSGGDIYPRLMEGPVFGHSDTHVPLQIADIIASGLLFPIACRVYSSAPETSPHRSLQYDQLKPKFGARLQALEYRYHNKDGERRGGFQVQDLENQRPTHLLFRD